MKETINYIIIEKPEVSSVLRGLKILAITCNSAGFNLRREFWSFGQILHFYAKSV
jgi:hypothetical protein